MKAWKKRTAADGNDFAAFKTFWEQAIRIADTSRATPAAQYEYGLNITEINDDKSTASRTSMLENSLSSFGSAYAATEERVRTQTDTINNLQGQINTLQQQLCHSLMARPPAYAPPPYPPRRNTNYHRGGHGGRNQHVPTGPPATQVTPPNPYKRFENMNYCHTHGGDIDDNHTSATCTRPGMFHNYHATRENTMGGSISGLHKTIMPSAVGRRPPSNGRQTNYNRATPLYQGVPQQPMYPMQPVTRPPPPNQYNNYQAVPHNPMPPAMVPTMAPTTPPITMPMQPRAMSMTHPVMQPPMMAQTYSPMMAPLNMPTMPVQQQHYGFPSF